MFCFTVSWHLWRRIERSCLSIPLPTWAKRHALIAQCRFSWLEKPTGYPNTVVPLKFALLLADLWPFFGLLGWQFRFVFLTPLSKWHLCQSFGNPFNLADASHVILGQLCGSAVDLPQPILVSEKNHACCVVKVYMSNPRRQLAQILGVENHQNVSISKSSLASAMSDNFRPALQTLQPFCSSIMSCGGGRSHWKECGVSNKIQKLH